MATTATAEQGSGLARYTFRLRVSSTALDRLLTEARQSMVWLREGASVPQQQVIRDFATSRAKAVRDIKARVPVRRRAGMPRVKRKRDALPTLNYTRRGFRLKKGRLHLAGGIVLTVVWSRDLPATPSSVRVYRDGLGHWYASFVVATEPEPLPATGRVLGVDWGVKETATTTSDAHDLPHPEHGKSAARKLGRYQRMMARRRPAKGKGKAASKGYRSARRQAAKVHKKVVRQRQDTARKWAKAVVRDHDAIAVEDFRPKFLAKTSMARKAADAAIGATKTALIEMGRKHARDIRLVHPAHTTMDCASCGARTKHALPLSERIYTCTACGAVSPRDKNSARMMLVRAGLNPAGADRVRAGGPQVPSQREPEILALSQGGEDVKALSSLPAGAGPGCDWSVYADRSNAWARWPAAGVPRLRAGASARPRTLPPMNASDRTPADLLRSALAADPARPLVTFYDDATGERVELSVATFANWVAKTANLLQGDLAAEPGDRLALLLPAHWQSAVWLLACASVGVVADVQGDPAAADLVVSGPDTLDAARACRGERIALALRPLGGRFPQAPEGFADYAVEVPGQGDRFAPFAPVDPDAPALTVGGVSFTAAELVARAREDGAALGLGAGARLLSGRTYDTWDGLSAGLYAPLATGGSVVLCRHRDQLGAEALAQRVDSERVTLTV